MQTSNYYVNASRFFDLGLLIRLANRRVLYNRRKKIIWNSLDCSLISFCDIYNHVNGYSHNKKTRLIKVFRFLRKTFLLLLGFFFLISIFKVFRCKRKTLLFLLGFFFVIKVFRFQPYCYCIVPFSHYYFFFLTYFFSYGFLCRGISPKQIDRFLWNF